MPMAMPELKPKPLGSQSGDWNHFSIKINIDTQERVIWFKINKSFSSFNVKEKSQLIPTIYECSLQLPRGHAFAFDVHIIDITVSHIYIYLIIVYEV